MRILITGASGVVGRHLVHHLGPRHDLVHGDLHPDPADPRARRLDVTDLGSVIAAAEGVDAIIHLAIASGHEGPYEDDAFNELRFDVNVKGVYHVMEAARRCGVPRVVHTSSLMVVWGYGPGEYVGPNAAPRPVGTYALTKRLGEEVAEHYARQFGIAAICLRIAKPVDLEDVARRQRPLRPQWVPVPDLVRAYELALTAPAEFEIIHLTGESSRRRWELERARDVLGYEPTIRLEDLGYTLDEDAPLE